MRLPRSNTAENLTTSLKSAVIKAILCDRQTKIIPLPFPARHEPDAGHGSRKNLPCRSRKIAFGIRVALLLGLIISFGFKGLAQEQPSEYQIKAAFLFNFAKFVEWPPQAFSDTNAPIVIGVMGKNVFGTDLEKTIRDKTVNNRHFKFIEIAPGGEATHCHILFISPSEKDNLSKIVDGLHNASVLTVSELDQFIKAGGMINFTIEDSKIRFQISDDAAKKAGLKISSKLLSLAAHGR
jgi:hypothetical protein